MSSTKMPGEFQLIQHLKTMLAQTNPAQREICRMKLAQTKLTQTKIPQTKPLSIPPAALTPMTHKAGEGQVILGIGDDCAVFQGTEGKYLLVTTDMLVEDVHFSRSYSSIRQIGQKAMIVNISDIAAMGGEPRFAFISLALPASFSLEEFDELWQGMAEVAKTYSLLILGGDTNASFPQVKEHGLVINITLIGDVWPQGLISRQGARQGDLILLTGQVGDSAAGLDLLQSIERSSKEGVSDQGGSPGCLQDGQSDRARQYLGDIQYLQDSRYQQAIQRHRVPAVRLAESRIISRHHLATAMIDVSDGLAGDLRHLCNQGHFIQQDIQEGGEPALQQGGGTILQDGAGDTLQQKAVDTFQEKAGYAFQGRAGAVLWADRLPISDAVIEIARLLQRPALSYALCGGEDYELLFTVPPDLADKAKQMIEQETGTLVSIIGEITDEAKGIHLIDAHGQTIPVPESGFDHFRVTTQAGPEAQRDRKTGG